MCYLGQVQDPPTYCSHFVLDKVLFYGTIFTSLHEG